MDGLIIVKSWMFTGGNRTMVAAATIVSMAAANGERISIFPLVCPNNARCVSFSAPDMKFVKGRSLVITADVAVDTSFLVIGVENIRRHDGCNKWWRWLQLMLREGWRGLHDSFDDFVPLITQEIWF